MVLLPCLLLHFDFSRVHEELALASFLDLHFVFVDHSQNLVFKLTLKGTSIVNHLAHSLYGSAQLESISFHEDFVTASLSGLVFIGPVAWTEKTTKPDQTATN